MEVVSVPFADAVERDTRVCLSLRWRRAGVDDYIGIGQYGTVGGDRSGCMAVRHYGGSDFPAAVLRVGLHVAGAAIHVQVQNL